ncbi:MAG: hypothetical protein ACREFL_12060 [Stellaceae bacterium]
MPSAAPPEAFAAAPMPSAVSVAALRRRQAFALLGRSLRGRGRDDDQLAMEPSSKEPQQRHGSG